MRQFGVAVGDAEAPAVAARGSAVIARDTVDGPGNEGAAIIAAQNDGNDARDVEDGKGPIDSKGGEIRAMAAGDSTSDAGEVAKKPPCKRKRGDEEN